MKKTFQEELGWNSWCSLLGREKVIVSLQEVGLELQTLVIVFIILVLAAGT
jgi:hypothetical protein